MGNWLRRAWEWLTGKAEAVWDAVMESIESLVGWVLSGLAFLIGPLFSIPVVGSVLK